MVERFEAVAKSLLFIEPLTKLTVNQRGIVKLTFNRVNCQPNLKARR